MLSDPEIEQIVRDGQGDLQKCVQRLIDLANEHGGEDNVTAVLIRIAEDEPAVFRTEGDRISNADLFGSENTLPG
jgi:serine/threonine protein phosphatase PrpC